MLENVPGLQKTRKGKRYLDEVRGGLEKAGYRVSYDVVELADYGVPQFRKRFVLIGSRGRRISIPSPTHRDPKSKSTSRRRPWRTVSNAIAGLPTPPPRSMVKAGKAKAPYQWHYARDIAKVVQLRLTHAMRSGGSRASLPDSLRLTCHQRHPDGFHDVYGVMEWNKPSPTITSGCTNASKGRFGHPKQARPLTAVEAAALQTFPWTYKFKGSGLESVAAQIGNALPRRFAKIAGKAIIKRLT
jgi:DNA (cytosine-5)-methyltransferase 1